MLVAIAATVAFSAHPSGAATVDDPGTAAGPDCELGRDSESGQARCEDGSGTPGGGGPARPGVPDHAARWARWCFRHGPFQDGYEVQFTVLGQIPPENYDEINANPDVPGYRYLEDGVDYFDALVSCIAPGVPPGGLRTTLSGPELADGPDPFALRAEALSRVVIADPPAASNPPWDDPDHFGIVHIPTWFWLEPGYWEPITETATDPAGILTVTVTATPIQSDWDPGDGSTPITCLGPDGAGIAWTPGLPDDATCPQHTYTSSSADQPDTTYPVTITATWEFTWTLNGIDQGPFGTVTADTALTYTVGEIQAIETP